MKRALLLLMMFIVVLLSACNADMDPINDGDDVLQQILSYDYSTGTFNNAPSTGYLEDLNDYSLEFFALYDEALSRDYVTNTLSETQITSYQAFFDKLEAINDYSISYFELDSSELTALLESRDITVEPIDIFTFNAIKNTFEEMNYQTITVRTSDYLEILLNRPLTSDESDGLELLQELRENYYYDYYEPFPVLDYAGTIDHLELIANVQLTDDERLQLQAFFNVLETLSN